MNRFTFVPFAFLSLILLNAGVVAAETIEGKVHSIDLDKSRIRIDAETRLQQRRNYDVRIVPDTALKGIRGFDELEVGDSVIAEIETTLSGDLSLRKIEVKALPKKDLAVRRTGAAPGESRVGTAAPVYAASYEAAAENQWDDKLGRGFVNFITSPVEIFRSIDQEKLESGPAQGWTVGFVKGLGRTLYRAGAGLVEFATFPFDWPKENKEPLIQPEYAWNQWPH